MTWFQHSEFAADRIELKVDIFLDPFDSFVFFWENGKFLLSCLLSRIFFFISQATCRV